MAMAEHQHGKLRPQPGQFDLLRLRPPERIRVLRQPRRDRRERSRLCEQRRWDPLRDRAGGALAHGLFLNKGRAG